MRFAAGIIFYQDKDGLKRLLDSIAAGFDYMFCLDGKFPRHPGDTELSTDGSRELVLSYPNAVLFDCPWPEYEKRQYYLRLCQEYAIDYLCILDSDEYAEAGDWASFRQEMYEIVQNKFGGRHNVFSIYIQVAARAYDNQVRAGEVWIQEHDIQYGHYPRIWYQPYNMEYYKGAHYFYRMREPTHMYHNAIQVPSMEIIKAIKFRHDHLLRSRDHQWNRRKYQEWLVPYETHLIMRWDAIQRERQAEANNSKKSSS